MKVKSQETLQMLNPHAIYLNVRTNIILIILVRKESNWSTGLVGSVSRCRYRLLLFIIVYS